MRVPLQQFIDEIESNPGARTLALIAKIREMHSLVRALAAWGAPLNSGCCTDEIRNGLENLDEIEVTE